MSEYRVEPSSGFIWQHGETESIRGKNLIEIVMNIQPNGERRRWISRAEWAEWLLVDSRGRRLMEEPSKEPAAVDPRRGSTELPLSDAERLASHLLNNGWVTADGRWSHPAKTEGGWVSFLTACAIEGLMQQQTVEQSRARHLRSNGWVTAADGLWSHPVKTADPAGSWVSFEVACWKEGLPPLPGGGPPKPFAHRAFTSRREAPSAEQRDQEIRQLLDAGWMPVTVGEEQGWIHPDHPEAVTRERALRELAFRTGARFRDHLEDLAREDDVLKSLAEDWETAYRVQGAPLALGLLFAGIAAGAGLSYVLARTRGKGT